MEATKIFLSYARQNFFTQPYSGCFILVNQFQDDANPNRRHNRHQTNNKTTDKMPTLRKIKRAAIPTHKPTQIAAHLILPNRTQSPPTTRQVDY